MTIADTRKEALRHFQDRSSLVVIVDDERYPRNMMYGPAPEIKSDYYPLPCSVVTRNCFETFSHFDAAWRIARRIFAIERKPVHLAECRLTYKAGDAIVRPGAQQHKAC
jgi:hypothetical protein